MKYINAILIVIFLFSCSSSDKKILQEATNIHNQSLEVEKEVSEKFEELQQVSNSINIQGRALTEDEIRFTREVELLGLSLNYWQENHLEVPKEGYQNDNKDAPVKFTANDILTIQKEFNDSIKAIRARLEDLTIPSSN